MSRTLVCAAAVAAALTGEALAAPATNILQAQTDSIRARIAGADSGRTDSGRALERVIVSAFRAADAAPIAQKTLRREAIMARQFGQDVPLLLQGASPSLTAHTETGTPFGYSYLRLRGIDQTRLNITLDGIPLNDMEDQVLYFANLSDLLSNAASVQIQRGVGTSSAGTASFAGSVNIETVPVASSRAGVDATVQGGSFGARRISAGAHTGVFSLGRLPGQVAVTTRGGAQSTDGYRYRSGVAQRSAFLSAGWVGARDLLKLTAIAGLLRDTLAYVGATPAELAADRRVNPLSVEDRDRFGQQLVALSYTRALASTPAGATTLATTVYRNSTGGSYDFFAAPDVYTYGLDYTWYGVTSALHHETARWRADVGVNANDYARRHRGYLARDPRTAYYDNTGEKRDASAFAKGSYAIGRARLFGDVQLRQASFRYRPDTAAGIDPRSITWTFVNPKAGVTVALSPRLSAFASLGRTTREPARIDLLAGADNLDSSNVAVLGDFTRVRPESVRDAEAGVTFTGARGTLSANVYSMDFRNDIALIGLLSASGSPLRRNVGASYRRGVELDGTWQAAPRLALAGTLAWSRNRIRGFTDASQGTGDDAPRAYTNTEPLLTPRVLSSQRATLTVWRGASIAAEGRYQARAFLDNRSDAALVLPAFYVLDASLRVPIARHALVARAANVGNSQRYGSGYGLAGVPYYFVLPPRSVFVSAELAF